jgi:hypothetical protein
MRKFVLSLAAAGAALVAASPAAAQYYPQQYGYGSNSYGYNGYGHGNFGEVRALQARIDSIEHQIRMLDRRNVIRDDRADRLRDEADRLESLLHRAARYGLNPYEANDISARIARLEQRVQFSMNRYGGYGRYGHDGYYADRDDRRGYDRDDRWDHDRD